jgi:Zn-dependent protease
MRFTPQEIKELLKAWLAISLAFAIAFGGLRTDAGLLIVLGVSLLTVGVGFVLHELAHKFVAQRYGADAAFHAFNQMLIFALLTSFVGIIFAIPGAVFIKTRLRLDQHGKVALAGPMTNVLLAAVFAFFVVLFPGVLGDVATYGLRVNAWLALFNMLPFFGADGATVLSWSKPVYGFSLVVAAMAMLASYLL